MLTTELTQTVLELPADDRLELARQLIESVSWPAAMNETVAEGLHRIEAVATGRTPGLTEEQFRSTLRRWS